MRGRGDVVVDMSHGRRSRLSGFAGMVAVGAIVLSACGETATKGDTASPSSSDPAATNAAVANPSADLGFRPDMNGFAFPNYGNDIANLTNLTPAEMTDIFGTGVCTDPSATPCTLTPPAQTWMDTQNKSMAGGHCQGMSVTALLFYKGVIKASDFGADTVPGLTIADNAALQRRIAESFQYQYFPGVQTGTIVGTPVEVLTALTTALTSKTTTYGLGIYKADHTGGHEITPLAVQDKGNGVSAILVYDNNYPKALRELDVDTNANTWTYVGSTNPAESEGEYKGDATTKTLSIDPLEPGEGKQPCPFCQQVAQSAQLLPLGRSTSTSADTTSLEDIYLDGDPNNHAHLLITDAQGHRVGYAGGTFVNEIPGAVIEYPKLGKDFTEAEEPEYYIPGGTALTITVDGTPISGHDNEEVGMIGPGSDAFVSVSIGAGQKDTMTVNDARTAMTYAAGGDEKPSIEFGSTGAGADFTFTVNPTSLASGSTLGLSVADTTLSIDATSVPATAAYDLEVQRFDADGNNLTFKHSAISIPGASTAQVAYSGWDHSGDAIPATVGGQAQQLSDQG